MSTQQIEITILGPGALEHRLALHEGVLNVGRAEDNDLVLPDVAVSRRHARLHVSHDSVVVEDVGSGNGTYIQGKSIKRQEVGDNEEVFIEPFTLKFSFPQLAAAFAEMPDEQPAFVAPSYPAPSYPAPAPAAPSYPAPAYPAHAPAAPSYPAPASPVPAAPVDEVPRLAEPRLVLVAGKDLEPEYPIPLEGITLGRADDRGVVLRDPNASRRHSEVVRVGDQWLVRDMGSANGTLVNTLRIKEHVLCDGDFIKIGTTEFQFVISRVEDEHSVSEGTKPFANVMFTDPNGPPPGAPSMPSSADGMPGFAQAAAGPTPPSYSTPPPGPAAGFPAGGFPTLVPPSMSQAPAPAPMAAPAPHAPAVAPSAVQPAAYPSAASAPAYGAPAPAYGAPAPAFGVGQPPQAYHGGPQAPSPYGVPPAASHAPAPFSPAAPAQPFGQAAPGGFGAVEMSMEPAKKGKGRKMRTGGVAGKPEGSFLQRNIRRLTIGIGLFTMMLIAFKMMRDAQQDMTPARRGSTATATRASTSGVETTAETAGAVSKLLDEGNQLFKEGNYLAAVEKYADVQKIDSRNPTAIKMGYHACEFLILNDLAKTVKRRSTSEAEQQAAFTAAMKLADDAIAGKRGSSSSEAIAALKDLKQYFPDDASIEEKIAKLEGRVRAGVVAQKRKQQEEHESSINDLFATAKGEVARGDLISAIKAFEKVLAADPGKQTDLYWQAEEQIRQAKSTLSERARTSYRSGVDAMKGQDYQTARTEFRKALRMDPYNNAAARRLDEVQEKLNSAAQKLWSEAEVYEKSNQVDMAIGRYRKVIEYCESPSSPLAAKAQGRIDKLMR